MRMPAISRFVRIAWVGSTGDIDTLGAIAARSGLDEAEVRGYLNGEAGTSEVRAEEQRARRLGTHAVPCFILDRGYAISGAQEPETFLPLFDIASGVVKPALLEA
jgi:predicted DsbA family dithiol-disulfide isomerase